MRPASTAARSKNLSQSSVPCLRPSCLAQARRVASSRGGARTSRSILLQLLGSCPCSRQNSHSPSRCRARNSLTKVPNIIVFDLWYNGYHTETEVVNGSLNRNTTPHPGPLLDRGGEGGAQSHNQIRSTTDFTDDSDSCRFVVYP